MKILVVGAGAVGTVYGRYFQLGGADVSFLVKEKYAESCRQGFQFYPLNRSKHLRSNPIQMSQFEVLTHTQDVASRRWDYVVLTMSSPALREGWLGEFLQAIGSAALVTLQPGLEDREYILQRFNESKLIEGMIPIISYFAPLPGEKLKEPGIAYWLPPGASGTFSGSQGLVEPLVALLRKAGFPAKVSRDVRNESLVPSVILTILVIALENSGWSFKKLVEGPQLKLAVQAVPEVLRVTTRRRKLKNPILVSFFIRPLLVRSILFLSRWIIPFDLETYLRVHFTKVQDQMHESMRGYARLAGEYSSPSPALSLMLDHLASFGA